MTPVSDLLEALGTVQFRDALGAGIEEAIDSNDFEKSINCFDETAMKNGLYLKVAPELIRDC